MLELSTIIAGYGSLIVLDEVTVNVDNCNEVVALLGANGAGKSTLCRAASGLLPITSGSVILDGAEITGHKSEAIVKAGLVHALENRRLFPQMTVVENLLVGAYSRRLSSKAARIEVEEKLTLFPEIHAKKDQPAGMLSGGEQQMVAIARALMASPKVLILDEPSHGLAPVLVKRLSSLIRDIADSGVPVLLVEQNVGLAQSVASRVYVMANGRVVAEGAANEIFDGSILRDSYLGKG